MNTKSIVENIKEKGKKMKTLTENLKLWRKKRNISNANYLSFVGNILEELLEPIYEKVAVDDIKTKIVNQYFSYTDEFEWNKEDIVDAIQDIQVFCINETELMGYDNVKCNNEVFKHIDCRKQNPIQKEQWEKFGAFEKWEKDRQQNQEEIYQPNYESCKL